MDASYSLIQTVAPTIEPVDLPTAKLHLRITDDFTADDSLIDSLIRSAREEMEAIYGYAFCTQTFKQYMPKFYGRTIELARPPLQTVTHVKYFDANNAIQTVTSTDYIVNTASRPGLITLDPSKSWPTTYERPDAVEVQFVAGYGVDVAVPFRIKAEILIRVAEGYEHRGEQIPDNFKRSHIIGTWPERLMSV